MAQAISPTLVKDICHWARKIEKKSSSILVPEWLQTLNSSVANYLAQVDRSTLQRRFFAWELYEHHQKFFRCKRNKIVQIAKEVQRAARYLEQSTQEKPNRNFFLLAENRLEEFDRALNQNDDEKLHSFSRRLNELHSSQLDLFFHWAISRWDKVALHRILKHCELPTPYLDMVVGIAFDRKAFGVTLYALMLFQFEALSPETQKAIEQWLDKRGSEISLQQPLFRVVQEEGEPNGSELFEELRKAMRKGDLDEAKLLIQTPAFAALSQRDTTLLLQELFDYPEAFVLLAPYSAFIQLPLLRELLYYGIQNGKWKGVLFLMEAPSFRGLGIQTLCDLDDQLSRPSCFEARKAKDLVEQALNAHFAKR